MNVPINAKRLRATLPDVVERVRKGTRFTVIYRSRPAFQIVPVDDKGAAPTSVAEDTLYRAAGDSASKNAQAAAVLIGPPDTRQRMSVCAHHSARAPRT